jgi:acylphosphatase
MALVFSMTQPSERLQATVRGQVQGVSFRAATQTVAQRLGLRGWVRNRPDGGVEVVAEGPRPALDRLMDYLRAGPPAAQVSAVEPRWLSATGEFQAFDIQW